MRITGAGNITVASDANGAVVSGSQSVQTQSLVRAISFSNTTMDGTVRITGAGNAVTVASDASGAVISVQTTQTVQPIGSASAAGNTTGTLTAIPLSGNLGIAGGNNITISQSNGAASTNLTISGAAQSNQTQSNIQGIAASNTTYNTGTVQFTGSNMVTVKSAGGQQVVIDATQTVQTQNIQAISVSANASTSGTLANISSGTLSLVAGPNITLSQNANTVAISAAAPSGAQTLSQWQNMGFAQSVGAITTAGTQGSSISIFPLNADRNFDGYMTASTVHLQMSASITGTPAAQTYSLRLGIYSISNSDTLALVNSAQSTFTTSGSAATSVINGALRHLSFHSSLWSSSPAFSPAPYYGAFQILTSGGAPQTMALWGQYQYNTSVRSGTFGAASSSAAFMGEMPFSPGVFASTSNAFPASMHRTQINKVNTANYNFVPMIVFQALASTY